MKKEDLEFLKELQHELRTQSNEYNADPVVWGIMETKPQLVPNGCGDETIALVCGEECRYTINEFVDHINEYYIDDEDSNDIKEKWAKVDKTDWYSLEDFVVENYNLSLEFYDVEYQDHIARGTGAFITKRAAKEYVRKYGYNHRNPRVWSMCAYRNEELERLLNILKDFDFDKVTL